MSVRDTMAANLVCHITGVDAETAIAALKAAGEQSESLYGMVDAALKGPVGEVELPCECGAVDGIQIAVDILKDAPTGDLTKEAEDAVREDRQYLIRQLTNVVQQKDDPVERLMGMLSKMGFKATRLL